MNPASPFSIKGAFFLRLLVRLVGVESRAQELLTLGRPHVLE